MQLPTLKATNKKIETVSILVFRSFVNPIKTNC